MKLTPSTQAANANNSQANGNATTITPLVKHVLSRELQLYFTRLTEALGGSVGGGAAREDGEGDDMRNAALGSLRNDPGLHQLVPYFVSWGGEQVRLPHSYRRCEKAMLTV